MSHDIRLTLRDRAGAAFGAAIDPFLSRSRSAAGNLDFQLLRVHDDARPVALLERWADLVPAVGERSCIRTSGACWEDILAGAARTAGRPDRAAP